MDMDYETAEETEVMVEEGGEIPGQNEPDAVENVLDQQEPGDTETETFNAPAVEDDSLEYARETEPFVEEEIQSHEEVNISQHEEYSVNEEFVTEEPYQQEIISNEVVEEELESNNIENEEEVVQYQEQQLEDYPAEDVVVQEELVSDQGLVDTQEEEISNTEQNVLIGEDYATQEQDSHEDLEAELQQEETVQDDSSGTAENVTPSEENEQPQQEAAAHDSDEDFDNVVEVEQKVESDAEDDNIAEHVSDSDNDDDEKPDEEIKLGNVSEDDLRGASSGSEHEASDVEEHSASPMKKHPAILESDDDEDKEEEKKKREQEAAIKMFDSDSEDEEKGGVGELIADIFGESDDEGEEFTGFGAEEVSKNQKSTKAVISDDSDDDSLPARVDDSDADDDDRPKSKKSTLPEDSDSDEGVKSSSFQGMSDFDIMLAKKKEENRRQRKRRDNSTFISDADDIINAMLTKMKEAAESDRDSNVKRKPALAKMKMLPSVVRHLKKQNLKEQFVDNGVIAAIADWLSILPDRSLPHITIRSELLKVLHDLPSVGPQTLKHSGIGKAVMILFKHPKEARVNKDSAGRLINKWSRPIFGLNENFKSMTREEREQRDLEQMPQAKRRKLTGSGQSSQGDPRMDAELGQLRPGEAGFVMRARVPMPSTKDYVVRPKWNIDTDDKVDDDDDEQPALIVKRRRSAGAPRSSKKDERLDKHIRSFAEKKRSTKLQRAVKISIEGNKMSIV